MSKIELNRKVANKLNDLGLTPFRTEDWATEIIELIIDDILKELQKEYKQ